MIPGTNTTTTSGSNKIPAGETVLVIKTTKGVYIRTNSGRIFAVRSKNKEGDAASKKEVEDEFSGSGVLAGNDPIYC